MCDISKFLVANPRTRKIGVIDESISKNLLKNGVPPDIIAFLMQEGIASYRDDFFCTTNPQDYHQTLSEWGLKGADCHTFLKTAFGSLCFSLKGKIFQLEPINGYLFKGLFDFCDFINLLVPMVSFMEGSYFDIYQKIEKRQPLASDELYGLVPARPLGGSLETSNFEVMKAREHLSILAQLFNHKARKL